ncbi:hypothetical protein [Roseovarius phycicola]|uniref:Uncharacterized protein n=1 Tax=Roseovarius phycicola TaxID=3080976 RepID=A0ABZ2HKQ5_9RHOB
MRSEPKIRAACHALRRTVILCGFIAVAGCTQFPDLNQSVSTEARNGNFPALVPVEVLRADAPAQQVTDTTTTTLEARVAALRSRANRLRGTVLNRSARARLEQKPDIPAEG